MQSIEHRLLVRDCIHRFDSEMMNRLSAVFYTHLFRLRPDMMDIFNGGVPMLNRKFNSFITTYKNLKHLEKISAALEGMAERHVRYHAKAEHLAVFREALLLTLAEVLGDAFDDALKMAWQKVFDEVAAIMTAVLARSAEEAVAVDRDMVLPQENNLFAMIGSEAKVAAVHQRFYDAIYEDEYIGTFFHHRAKRLLVKKQTEFMVAAFGGPNHYRGEPPAFVHMHMFITKEMSEIREVYLRRAILEEGLSEDICRQWLAVDRSFHASIEKEQEDECVMRCWGQQPMVAKRPAGYTFPQALVTGAE